MHSRHHRTLAAIFESPTRADLDWSDIEKLFVAPGGDVSEGAGSRVLVALKGARHVFHRPHPCPETGKAAVRDVRDFLIRAGVEP